MKILVLGLMPEKATPEEYIAAGPWCFCGREVAFPGWETKFTFAPEPLAQPEAATRACKAAQALCCRLLPETAALLVAEPDQWPASYWQVLLAPWLIDLASQLIDRALRASSMLQAFGNASLAVPLLPQDCEFGFTDEHDFTLRGSLGADFNHWLFSLLLRERWPASWQAIELEPVSQKQGKKPLFSCLKPSGPLLNMAFPPLKGISLLEEARWSRKLEHRCKTTSHALDWEKTFSSDEALARIKLPADLTQLLRICLPGSIRNLRHKPVKPDKDAPRLKIAPLASQENAVLRQKLAAWRAAGNRIGYIQHGANYGQVATPCAAEVVEYSQDVFFTWGWRAQGGAKGNFVPMPVPQLSRHANSWQQGDKLIFIGTEMPAYGRRLDSHPTPLQYVKYRQAKAEFFSALGQELQKKSLYRPYFKLPGTLADAEWLLPQFPHLGLCEGPLIPHMQRCRMLVIDHHGTSLLEAMAANIPVILYWQRSFWPVSPEFDILLELLAQAGIWHETAERAARKAREIWNEPEKWQNSEMIQLARRVFCANQAWHSANYAEHWLKTLSNI